MERPALPQLAVGDPVLVYPGWKQSWVPATVTKVGRLYYTVQMDGSWRDWQFSIATGRFHGDGYGSAPALATAEQLKYDARISRAWETIHAAGFGSRSTASRSPDRLVLAVAEVIEQYRTGEVH